MDRGTLTSGPPYTGIADTPKKEEDWTLEALGNWKAYVKKTDGTTDLSQTREYRGRHTHFYLSFSILPQGHPTFQQAFPAGGFYRVGRQGAKTFAEAAATIEQGTPDAQE